MVSWALLWVPVVFAVDLRVCFSVASQVVFFRGLPCVVSIRYFYSLCFFVGFIRCFYSLSLLAVSIRSVCALCLLTGYIRCFYSLCILDVCICCFYSLCLPVGSHRYFYSSFPFIGEIYNYKYQLFTCHRLVYEHLDIYIYIYIYTSSSVCFVGFIRWFRIVGFYVLL